MVFVEKIHEVTFLNTGSGGIMGNPFSLYVPVIASVVLQ